MNRPLLGCFVPPDKITRYLLAITHIDGGPKAKFFMSFGFDPMRPHELRDALLEHAANQSIVDTWTDPWGEHWDVLGPLVTPSKRTPIVRSGWVKDSSDPPRLATAIPG